MDVDQTPHASDATPSPVGAVEGGGADADSRHRHQRSSGDSAAMAMDESNDAPSTTNTGAAAAAATAASAAGGGVPVATSAPGAAAPPQLSGDVPMTGASSTTAAAAAAGVAPSAPGAAPAAGAPSAQAMNFHRPPEARPVHKLSVKLCVSSSCLQVYPKIPFLPLVLVLISLLSFPLLPSQQAPHLQGDQQGKHFAVHLVISLSLVLVCYFSGDLWFYWPFFSSAKGGTLTRGSLSLCFVLYFSSSLCPFSSRLQSFPSPYPRAPSFAHDMSPPQKYYEKQRLLAGLAESVDDADGNYVPRTDHIIADRYHVKKKLGKGSFGVVVQAHDAVR